MSIKRFLSAVLILCLLVCASPAALAAGVPFTDVKPADWFYSGVEYAYETGLMGGTGDNRFSPSIATTRGMIVTILHRMQGEPRASASRFADVAKGSYYEKAVAWAAENGIVTGHTATQFSPNDPITREQMATILYRYALWCGLKDKTDGKSVSGYSDWKQVSSYARDAMGWANANGIITGQTATTLVPKGTATRAQAAVILSRFCMLLESDAKPAPGGSDKPAEQPDWEGVDAETADPNAENLFLLSASASSDGKTVEVVLTLGGQVCLCGFDLQLLYDEDAFTLQTLDTDHDLAVIASEEPGCVSFNYAAAKNITKSKTVLTATFRVRGEPDENAVFSLNPVEVIKTDSNYEVVDAAYTLTYCKVG